MKAKDAEKEREERYEILKKFIADVKQWGTVVEIVLKEGLTAVKVLDYPSLAICDKSKSNLLDRTIILGSRFLGRYAGDDIYDAGIGVSLLEIEKYSVRFDLPEGRLTLTENQIASLTPYKPEQSYRF